MQAQPGGVQMFRRGLQQVVPSAQTAVPQMRFCATQAPTPSVSRQTKPEAQRMSAHEGPLGTQRGPVGDSSQWVVAVQRTLAQVEVGAPQT
jgi:hypothetical protein